MLIAVLFCGINPGTRSAAQGRHYAHPSNHFYQCVHAAGITSELLTPEHDVMFPTLAPHALGLTNLAHRPTRRSEQLRTQELECGVPALVHKVRQYKPRVVCFVGKQIGRVFEKVLAKKHCLGDAATLHLPRSVLGFWFDRSSGTKTFPAQDGGYGVMPLCVVHDHQRVTLFYCTPSTSARVTHHQLAGKIRIMSHIPALLRAPEEFRIGEDTFPVLIPQIIV